MSKGAFRGRTPWRGILTSLPVWGLIVIQVGHDWGFFTMLTDLPKYMRSVLRFNIATVSGWGQRSRTRPYRQPRHSTRESLTHSSFQNGLLSSLPYLTMWVMSLVMSAIADWLLVRNILTVLQVRRVFTSIGESHGISSFSP